MNLNGQPLIARPTYATGRAVLALSLTVIFIRFYDEGMKLTGLKFLGVEVSGASALDAAFWVLILLMLSHIVSWAGDLQSFRQWNGTAKMSGSGMIGYGSNLQRTELANAVGRIEDMKDAADRYFDSEAESGRDANRENFDNQAERVIELLEGVSGGVSRLKLHGLITLFGWHLTVPIGFFGWAMFLLCNKPVVG